jgi:hypothetical protein
MVPTPTITPWPGISRGTDWTVPMVPGLVSVTVTPVKSSGETLLFLTLAMSSSYRAWKAAKSRVSASLMQGTRRVRLPSDLATSTARPSPTWGWRTTAGLPSTSVYEEFMTGTSRRARTTAYPMRWVKLTLPRPVRPR